MPVSPPPLWESLLLENPWPLVLGLGWFAVVMAAVGHRRQNRRLGVAAIATGAGAALVAMLAWVVETDREKIIARTRELIGHTVPLDLAAVGDCFTAGARLIGPQGDIWLEREGMLATLEEAARRQRLHEHSIRRVAAQTVSLDRGRSELAVTTRIGERGEFPVPTRWVFTWQREPDGQWRVASAQWLEVRGRAPSFGMWR